MIVPDEPHYILIRRRPTWQRLWNAYRNFRDIGLPVGRAIRSAWIIATCKPLTASKSTPRAE